MKKLIFFAIITLFPYLDILAQINRESEKEIDSIVEELLFSDSENLLEYIQQLNSYQLLYVSVGFADKTYFLGRDLGLDQYSLSSQVFYKNSNGIILGVSGAYYSDFNPKWDYTALTGGFGRYFGKHKNFSYEITYNRYIFSNANSNDFENSFDGNFSVETKDNSFGISADVGYFFGKKQGFQNSFDLYGAINIAKLNDNTSIKFEPLLSIQLGSENINTSRIEDLGLDIPVIDRIVGSFEKYSLRNIQLQLPLNLDLQNFQFETGINFNFPNALEFERNVKNSSFFSFKLSYIIDLK